VITFVQVQSESLGAVATWQQAAGYSCSACSWSHHSSVTAAPSSQDWQWRRLYLWHVFTADTATGKHTHLHCHLLFMLMSPMWAPGPYAP